MKIEKRLENALRISENIIDGKICPNNLYDLQLHLSDALVQVKELPVIYSYTMIKVKDIRNFQKYVETRYVKKQDGTYLNIVTNKIDNLETIISKINEANLTKALNNL